MINSLDKMKCCSCSGRNDSLSRENITVVSVDCFNVRKGEGTLRDAIQIKAKTHSECSRSFSNLINSNFHLALSVFVR